jgi:alpha-L-rhamnosidase
MKKDRNAHKHQIGNRDGNRPRHSPDDLLPDRLRCEYLVDPLGIDTPRPRLSWALVGGGVGRRQSAYRIRVASNPERLAAGEADIWDSHKVQSNQTAHVRYAGTPLPSGKRCWWQVQVWDEDGRPSRNSDTSRWEMGLEAEDWRASWIAGDGPAPRFRRTFHLGRAPRSARLYICGQGVYEASLNGQKVGPPLAPTLSYYPRRMLYDTLDVSSLVHEGENALGFWLSPGWFGDPSVHSAMNMPQGQSHALIAQLVVEYPDHSQDVIVTDGAWKTAPSPFDPVRTHWKYCFGMSGEVYDGTRETLGWDGPGFNDASWKAAWVVDPPTRRLCARMTEPNAVKEVVAPVGRKHLEPGGKPGELVDYLMEVGKRNWTTSVTHLADKWQKAFAESIAAMAATGGSFQGGYEIDMRKHISGRVKLVVSGRRGDWACLFGVDRHRLGGKPNESVGLRFAHRAFRYVPILFFGEGPEPRIASVQGESMANDLHHAGSFSCSDPDLNKVHDVARRTWAAHLLSGMPMDSWQERFGTGLVQSLEQAICCEDVGAFLTKWVADHRDQQRQDGYLPMSGGPIAFDYWSPNWSKNGLVLAPWLMYQYYGDRDIIEASYPAIARWLELCIPRDDAERTWQPPPDHGNAESGYGDHLRPVSRWYDPHTGDLFETLHILDCFRMAEEMARTLSREADAKRYRRIGERLAAKCNRPEFFDHKAGVYGGGDQACNAMALYLGIVPEDSRKKVTENLLQDIVDMHDGHSNTGFLGSYYLLKLLTALNRPDVARSIIANRTPPSWLTMLRHPDSPEELTILPEFFYGGMVPHPGWCNVGFWFYHALGGILPDPQHPGFERAVIRPQIPMGLEWVKAEYESIRGPIAVDWRRDKGSLTMTVTLPPNVAALVYVPSSNPHDVPAPDPACRPLPGTEAGFALFEAGPGRHTFESLL